MEKTKGILHGLIISGCLAQSILIGNTYGSDGAWTALSLVVLVVVIINAIVDIVGWK